MRADRGLKHSPERLAVRAPDRCHDCGEVGHRAGRCHLDRTIDKCARWRVRRMFAGECISCGGKRPPGVKSQRCAVCREKRRLERQADRDLLYARGLNARGKPYITGHKGGRQRATQPDAISA